MIHELALTSILLVCALSRGLAAENLESSYVWKPVKLGAGGYTMGISIHSETGDTYCRIDVNGAYKLDKEDNRK